MIVSPFDRGKADSYYGRPRDPHKWVNYIKQGACGTVYGAKRVETLTPTEINEYNAGYDENELSYLGAREQK